MGNPVQWTELVMKTQWKVAVLAAMGAVGVTAMVLGASVGRAGQAGRSVQAGVVPRAADGKPDFSGIWQVMSTANWNILPHAASKDGPAGMGVVEGGELPYQSWAVQKRDENYKNRLTADTDAKCFLPGVPRIMYEPFPFQISQTPAAVMMFFEYEHAVRNVFMNTAHPRGPIEWWMGDSRGTWDGDTLVVDVVHFNNETWFDRMGNHHSEQLHVVERYNFLDADHINYEATIEDLKVFTRPWKMHMVFYRHKEPNFQLLEYECYTFDDEAAGNLKPPTR
jgi:hypothetical protein